MSRTNPRQRYRSRNRPSPKTEAHLHNRSSCPPHCLRCPYLRRSSRFEPTVCVPDLVCSPEPPKYTCNKHALSVTVRQLTGRSPAAASNHGTIIGCMLTCRFPDQTSESCLQVHHTTPTHMAIVWKQNILPIVLPWKPPMKERTLSFGHPGAYCEMRGDHGGGGL